MARVFISYGTKNKELADHFIEFLQLGMGVQRADIFCTAFSEALPTGENFIEKIRTELEACSVVILLITEEYLKSAFCMAEMGVAWGLKKCCFPLLLVPYDQLNKTPLCGMQMRRLNNEEDISTIYDELFTHNIIHGRQTAEFNKRLPGFMSFINNLQKGNYRIEKDKSGYYTAVISEIRKVSEKYRCYGIKGQVQGLPDDGKADSDWIFFWKEMYQDFQVGDWVRFKISKSEIRRFDDLGMARNLYPSELDEITIY